MGFKPPSGGGSGDVVGPASATDGHLAVFDSTTGKLIKDGGAVPAGTVVATGAEIDIGTDDAKFASAKALEDSTKFARAAKFVAGAGALTGPAAPLTIGTAASAATGDFAAASNFIAGAGALTGPASPLTIGTAAGAATGDFSPVAGSASLVTVGTISSGNVVGGIADYALSIAKLANGTAGNLISYGADTHPAAVATGVAGQVLTSNGAGAAPTFQAASGFAWGVSASGTTDGGLSLTLSNSAGASASALKLVAGNIQSNIACLSNIQIGTSAKVMGLLIQGTGTTVGGAIGTGKNHLTIWGDTSNNANKGISIGNGASYTEKTILYNNGTASFLAGLVTFNASATGIVYAKGSDYSGCFLADLTADGGGYNIGTSNLTDAWVSYAVNCDCQKTSNNFSDRTSNTYIFGRLSRSNSKTSGTLTDNYNLVTFWRTSNQVGAGGTFSATGTVLNIVNANTVSAGSLTDTVIVAKFTQSTVSTGDILQCINGTTVKMAVTSGGNLVLGTTAAGASAADGVLALSNGATAPSTGVDLVQLYGVDITAGNASLGLWTEQAVVTEIVACDTTLNIKVNGTTYKLLMHT